MSSEWSKEVEWEGDFYGKEKGAWSPDRRMFKGRIQVHHTSDTVAWIVDGEDRFIWSFDEWSGFIKALDDLRKND